MRLVEVLLFPVLLVVIQQSFNYVFMTARGSFALLFSIFFSGAILTILFRRFQNGFVKIISKVCIGGSFAMLVYFILFY